MADLRPARASPSLRLRSVDTRALETLTLIIAASLTITALTLGRQIFIPMAIAVLLSFVLAAPVRWLRLIHAPRGLSVVLVVALACAIAALISFLLLRQATQLANDLPNYQTVISTKIDNLRSGVTHSLLVERISQTFRSLEKQTKPAPETDGEKAKPSGRPATPEPVPVEVHQPPPGPLDVLMKLGASAFEYLTTAGIVVIFVAFILLQREDLRDRLIKLAGAQDLSRTTAAIDDAAQRLSRYLAVQTMLNAGFGLFIGSGLALIGVPSPLLWGILAMLMRFVPYIGAFVAAAFPILLSAAVDPGWSMVAMTLALFLITEPIMGQVIEPLLYGHSTGLSPLAVVVSAIFWTWLWGPVGLLLATPLTVCLVVLGRHVERLSFLDIMLGDQPPLSAHESFYQRLLAGHAAEAAEDAQQAMREMPLVSWYDTTMRDSLLLAQSDLERGVLDQEQLEKMRDALSDVLEDLETMDEAQAPMHEGLEADKLNLPPLAHEDLKEEWRGPCPILIIPARGILDEMTCSILVQLCAKHGLPARVVEPTRLSALRVQSLDLSGTALACLVCVGSAISQPGLRFALRRIHRRLPQSEIMLLSWSETLDISLSEIATSIGAKATASMAQALQLTLASAKTQSSEEIKA